MNIIGSLIRDCSANDLSITRTINLRVCLRSNNGFAYNLLKDKSESYNVYTMYMNVLSRNRYICLERKASSFCIKRNDFKSIAKLCGLLNSACKKANMK